MSEKMKKTNNSKYPSKCHSCQYFDAEKDKCKKHKCKGNTDFSQCDTYLIKDSLVMY